MGQKMIKIGLPLCPCPPVWQCDSVVCVCVQIHRSHLLTLSLSRMCECMGACGCASVSVSVKEDGHARHARTHTQNRSDAHSLSVRQTEPRRLIIQHGLTRLDAEESVCVCVSEQHSRKRRVTQQRNKKRGKTQRVADTLFSSSHADWWMDSVCVCLCVCVCVTYLLQRFLAQEKRSV